MNHFHRSKTSFKQARFISKMSLKGLKGSGSGSNRSINSNKSASSILFKRLSLVGSGYGQDYEKLKLSYPSLYKHACKEQDDPNYHDYHNYTIHYGSP